MHFVKLPNFLSIESRPFDPDTYEDELDDESLQQQVGDKFKTSLRLSTELNQNLIIVYCLGFVKEGSLIPFFQLNFSLSLV